MMSETRDEILKLGGHLMQLKGYNAFSYQDIAKPLGMKNAAIHYHFPSKEDLAVGVLTKQTEDFESYTRHIKNKGYDEWRQLEGLIKLYRKDLSESKICLMGSLGTDYISITPPIQEAVKKLTDTVLAWLSDLLNTGLAKQVFAFSEEPRTKALLIMCNLSAGVQLARILDQADFERIREAIILSLKP